MKHPIRNEIVHLVLPPAAVRLVLCALALMFGSLALSSNAFALGESPYIETEFNPHNFIVVHARHATPIYVDPNDHPGVVRAAGDLQSDIHKVSDCLPSLVNDNQFSGPQIIVIGTLGRSALLDRIIREKHIDVSSIAGKWESFLIETVPDPLPGITSALIIAGSDKRGTIYGVYDLSEQIGVSPWYWWADVPVRHHETLTVKPGVYSQGPPAVKYRGIFLNDEAPALTGWVKEKYGNYNHQFYEKVFELILRLKGNYLWPAMWNNAFNEDDPLNPKLANEYGIVMGTSHHEPMMRAQQEWKRHGQGPWDYSKNGAFLREFWEQGLARNKDFENVVTIGMRGDGDLPMSDSANITLLEQVVSDQRKIIADVTKRPAAETPQVWALYKEVQDYYEQGMRVPDDVTLLWCDDNWGNIRRLPTPEERKRPGGAGIYYHFDYVGDPRNYKWINTNPIPKVWEQMNLALQYGADRIWIVNVGDLKPMEFPIEFFLSLAWNPSRWPKEKISEFTEMWVAREFGPEHAPQIADILSKYAKYNGRRKPELLEPGTYSLVNYREADSVIEDFATITNQAGELYSKLPADQRDAFYELVLHPTKASAVVNQLYITSAKNQLYASQGRARTNALADEAEALFKKDAELSAYYNRTLAGGKWDHMMDQTHIGYTYWQEPPVNNMPKVTRIDLPQPASMGVAVEGSTQAWPGSIEQAALPQFDAFSQQRFYIDVFNRGRAPFTFHASASEPWIALSESQGLVDQEKRLWVSVDWTRAPEGLQRGSVNLSSNTGQTVTVRVSSFRPASPTRETLQGFIESNGYVSIGAPHYTRRIDQSSARWEKIDDLGRTGSAMTVFPVTAASVRPGENAPCLEYTMYLFSAGTVSVEAILDPTLKFVPGRGLRYAISFDDAAPQIIDALADKSTEAWSTAVKDSVRKSRSTHQIASPGYHTLKFWMVDPGIVLQKLVVDLAGVKPSYLGPPESFHAHTIDSYPPVVHLTAEQDHQRIMDLLHITSLRNGPDGDPKSPRAANFDESNLLPNIKLPDPLILNNGQRVTTPQQWWSERRPQIIELFDRDVFGRVPNEAPQVKWEVLSTSSEEIAGIPAITKKIVGHVDNFAYPLITVDIQLTLTTPAKASGPVPVMMELSLSPEALEAIKKRLTEAQRAAFFGTGAGPTWQQQVLQMGWGYATYIPTSVQADNGAGLTEGIIGLVNKGQPRKLDDWGALRAWAWGASRVLDYFETDKAVDAKQLGIEGLSRYGKAALVAMAYDPRFAIGFIGSSGAGGAKILRRNFGEQLENLASSSEYHWMAGNFLKYAGPLTVDDLPVDAHELIALCAPRPVFISSGSQQVEGGWVDAKGMFLGAAGAGPVYALLGKKDLGTITFPPIETSLINGDIAFRQHTGGHTTGPNWPTFLAFASRYIKGPPPASASGGNAQVALTFDDLPVHGPLPTGMTRVDIANSIIQSLQAAHAPPTYGFVNAKGLQEDPSSAPVLQLWRAAGFPLGNHTFSHMDLDTNSVESFEQDLLANEPTLLRFMGSDDWHWLRFPFLHEGDTAEKHRAVEQFLSVHRYKVAQVTVSFGDYAYNEPYTRCLAKNDRQGIAKLEQGYLDGAAQSLEQGQATAKLLYGRDIKHVMLLHVGAFQTVMLPRLLDLLQQRGFQLIPLPEAQSDPAYSLRPDLSSKWDGMFLEQSLRGRHLTLPENSALSLAWLDEVCR